MRAPTHAAQAPSQYVLERLAFANTPAMQGQPGFNVRDAVQAQIQRLVSTHVWDGPTGLSLMRVGVPSLSGAGYAQKADVARYALALRDAIERNEPRLRGVRVSLEATRDALMPFQVIVSGQLQGESAGDSFRFELLQR